MREEMASADKGLSINHEKRSVADWLNYWIAEIAPANIKDSTLHTHKRHVANNIIPEMVTYRFSTSSRIMSGVCWSTGRSKVGGQSAEGSQRLVHCSPAL